MTTISSRYVVTVVGLVDGTISYRFANKSANELATRNFSHKPLNYSEKTFNATYCNLVKLELHQSPLVILLSFGLATKTDFISSILKANK